MRPTDDELHYWTVEEMYLDYYPLNAIMRVKGINEDILLDTIKEVLHLRTETSLSKVDLTPFISEPAIVKKLITKLYLIRNELSRRAINSYSLVMLNAVEEVDNYVKKAKIAGTSEWTDDYEEVDIIEETGGYLTIMEVYVIENGDPKDMIKHAKLLMDKLLIKPDNIKVMRDWEQHVVNCKFLGVDPNSTSEDKVKIMLEMQDYMNRGNND